MTIATPLFALRTYFTDKCGAPLVGGKVFSYEKNSLTPKYTFTDGSLQTPNTNPVVLDEFGKADIFLNGTYRFQVYSADGVLIEDKDNVFNIIDLSQVPDKEYVDNGLAEKASLEQLNAVGVGNKAYLTYAAMDADKTNIPAKSKITVTNDSTVANNGDWQWDGVVFTKSEYDPITQSKNYVDENALSKSYEPQVMQLVMFPTGSPYSFAVVDEAEIAPFVVKKDGTVISVKHEIHELTAQQFLVDVFNTNQIELGNVIQTQFSDDSEYVLAVPDDNDMSPFSIKKNGMVIIPRIDVSLITQNGKEISAGGTNAQTEIYSSPNEILDCAYTWWINPIACRMGRTTFGGGVGMGDAEQNYGDIKIWQKRQNSLLKAAIIGKIETVLTSTDKTDDHNAPAILLDPRPGAKYPLIVFQADHAASGSVTRMWRSRMNEVEGLTLEGRISQSDKVTYSQAYRNPDNPDQIFVIIRHDGNGVGDWRILRSDDNGDTWIEKQVFKEAGFYIGSRQSTNGITLVFQRNVMNDVDTKVGLCELRWDGSLVGINNQVLIADVFALLSPAVPFSIPNLPVIYEAETGFFRRVFDIREVATNKVQVLLAEFEKDSSVSPARVLADSAHFTLLTVDTSTGAVTRDNELPNAGNPMEAARRNAYFAGGCIVAENDLILGVWNYPFGTNTGKLARWKKSGTWAETVLDTASHELCRPQFVENYSYVDNKISRTATKTIAYMSGEYREFTDMTVSTKILEIS